MGYTKEEQLGVLTFDGRAGSLLPIKKDAFPWVKRS